MSEDKITHELTIAIRKADRRFEDDRAAGTKAYAECLRSELRERGLSLTLTGDSTPEEVRDVLLGALREHAEQPLEGEQPTSLYSPLAIAHAGSIGALRVTPSGLGYIKGLKPDLPTTQPSKGGGT